MYDKYIIHMMMMERGIFFNRDEYTDVYELVFDCVDEDFVSKDTIDPSKIKSVKKVYEYYSGVIKRRNARRVPLAVDLTFEILKFYIDRYDVVCGVGDVSMMDTMVSCLHHSSAAKVFKIVNQIVDMNQKAKNTISFSHVLKKLNFKHHEIISQIRHSFFHQETPNVRSIELCFRLLLSEIKRLYWDVNYAWIQQVMTIDDKTVKKRLEKYKITPLTRSELYNVDEYSDSHILYKEYQLYVSDVSRPSVSDFIKNKVKGMHRKRSLIGKISSSLFDMYSRVICNDIKYDSVREESGVLEDILYTIEDKIKDTNSDLMVSSRGMKVLSHVLGTDYLGKRKTRYSDKIVDNRKTIGKKKVSSNNNVFNDDLVNEILNEETGPEVDFEGIVRQYEDVCRQDRLVEEEGRIEIGGRLTRWLAEKRAVCTFKTIVCKDII